jgi:signal transduction histidine kinase/DNA-binding response OmpR family regulator
MKNISTKHLLIILLLVGITAILVLSVAAGLTGKRLARNNENLVAVALPLQAANNGLTTAVLGFIERQRAILSARSQPELEALEANVELRQHFNKELERLHKFSGNVPGVSSIMATMDASHDEFLSADQALFHNARLLLEINEALLLRVRMIEEQVAEAQRVTEGISGKVNLAIKRTKRRMRRAVSGKGDAEKLQGLVEKHLDRGQEDIQQASNDVRASMDALPAMALNMMLARDVDTLRSIKGNQSDQLVTRVEKSLDALGEKLSASPEYQESSEQVYDVIRNFWLFTSEGDRSMYELKLRSIELEKQMDQVRSRADAAAASIRSSLDELSDLVSSIRTSATVASEKTLRTSKYTTVAVSLFTLILFSVIGAAIYRAVIRSGEALSKAFDASEQSRILAGQAREEALQHKSAAETANQAKSAFLANMSHELRTPMNAILGYSEMLIEEAEDLEQEDFIPDLQKINKAGIHLLALINDVLDLAKIESGKMEAFAEVIDIDSLIDEVSGTAHPLIGKNKNTLSIERGRNLGRAFQDMIKLRQALFNLLSNAAKFTHDGTITLHVNRSMEAGVDWLIFAVSDTGIGIAQDKVEHVFEEFTQADDSTTRDYGGTGLGLAISRRFCQLLGGDLTAHSELGKGSTFTIRIPASLPGVEAPQEQAETAAAISGTELESLREAKPGSTILVIDDDPEACEIIERYLVKDGYAVVTASSGEQGLRLAHEIQPAVITLDVLMPTMDGWSVLGALKADPVLHKIPVIMLTMIDDRTRGYSLGAVDYLTKPVDRELLRKTLSRYYSADGASSVLLVEDDIETREMMARTLEKAGWAVSEAGNGQEALDIMSGLQPGLVLLDLMMPVMDGFDFLTAMRAQPEWRHIPVIVITAKDLTGDDRERLNGMVEDVIEKSAYTREQLLEHVSEAVAACNISETGTNTTDKNHE